MERVEQPRGSKSLDGAVDHGHGNLELCRCQLLDGAMTGVERSGIVAVRRHRLRLDLLLAVLAVVALHVCQ
jgi:hypothetical protein